MEESQKPETVTRIAKGTKVKADIKTEADIHIAGTVEGDIETKNRLVISETGKITGTVIAKESSISGKFTGELRVLNHITLSRSAVVDGFIFSKSITVDEEGTLIGILNIGEDVDVLNAKIKQAERKPSKSDEKQKTVTKNTSEKESKQLEIEGASKPEQHRYLKDVLIGIPGKINDDKTDPIRKSIEQFMHSLGFSLEIFDEPTNDPFFQKLSFSRKSPEAEDDIEKRFTKGKERLETALLNKGANNNGNEKQNAANALVNALKEHQEFVFVFGNVLLIQLIENDVQTIAAELVPKNLAEKLRNDPNLVTSPSKVYGFVEH